MAPQNWSLTGNAGTNPTNNFLGTTDNQPLVIKTSGTERIRVTPDGKVGVGINDPATRLSLGNYFGIRQLIWDGDLNNSQNENCGFGINLAGTSSFDIFMSRDYGLNIVTPTGPWPFPGYSARLTVLSNGNIGIGTTNPSYSLHLPAGRVLRIEGGTNAADNTNYFSFGGNGAFGIDAPGVPNGRFVVQNSGSVGIGTPSPQKPLDVASSGGIRISQTGQASSANEVFFADNGQIRSLDDNHRIIFNRTGNELEIREYGTITLSPGATQGQRTAQVVIDSSGTVFMNGKVGIGLNQHDIQDGEPTSSLVVGADAKILGTLTVSGDIVLTGADCAEDFDATDDLSLDPGTVVVINEGGGLRESQAAYDKKVAGVISGAGEFKPALVLDKRPLKKGRVPVALIGKAYCKVDAQYSPIEVGDLLTTSPTPGHAMKAADSQRAFGAIIGKALESIRRGTGLIPMLVALQ